MPIPALPPDTAPPSTSPALRKGLRLLAVVGLMLPWFFNLKWFASGGGVAPTVFWPAAMANDLTTALTIDVYLAALGFSIWVLSERRVSRPWLYVLMCFGIGLSFALPWYLSSRRAERGDADAAVSPAPARDPR